jgi:hypothetical protein
LAISSQRTFPIHVSLTPTYLLTHVPPHSHRAASVFTILCGTLLYTYIKAREVPPAHTQQHIPITQLNSSTAKDGDLEAQAPLMHEENAHEKARD